MGFPPGNSSRHTDRTVFHLGYRFRQKRRATVSIDAGLLSPIEAFSEVLGNSKCTRASKPFVGNDATSPAATSSGRGRGRCGLSRTPIWSERKCVETAE